MSDIKKISVVVPVFNEVDTIAKIIEKIEKAVVLGLEKEVVIVDDGSSDGTVDYLKTIEYKHKVFYNNENKGKGFSLKRGIENSSGGVVIVQDADLEYSPDEYVKLLQPILNDVADVVYGSRFMGGEPHRVLYFWHYIGNRVLTTFSNMLTDLNLTDMETCYKMFRREVVEKIVPDLESDRFGFEPEVTARISKLAKKNECRIYEVGISYSGRTYEEGKKISWRDGFDAFWCIIKYNLFG